MNQIFKTEPRKKFLTHYSKSDFSFSNLENFWAIALAFPYTTHTISSVTFIMVCSASTNQAVKRDKLLISAHCK